jgi:oxygen-dependent protoporphyrinogen oxidase
MRDRFDTIIIGAGITGLALSRALAARAVPHIVLEAAPEPGGMIRSRVVDGRVLEEGPQRTRLTPAVHRLIADLGIAHEMIAAPAGLPLYVYARGRLRRVPLSLRQLLSTDLFRPAGKARLLLEPFTAPARNGESVADLFTRRFGRAAYEDMLGPLFGGLYASDPATMPVRHALAPVLRGLGVRRSAVAALIRLPRGAGGTPPISFRGGLRTLTDAMYATVRPHVRLGSPARAIARDGTAYIVATDTADFRADRIVLTVPALAAATLLTDTAPAATAALARLRYNRIALVHLDAATDTAGLGYQVSFGERLETRGVTFNHSLFGRERLYTAFLGGAKNPALAERSDGELAAIACREFAIVMGAEASCISVARTVVPAWDSTWDALDGLALPEGIHLAANYESRIGIPGRLARAQLLADTIAPG